jgi:hemolysin III
MRRLRWPTRLRNSVILWRQEAGWLGLRIRWRLSRQRSRFREPTSGFTHLAGAGLSFLALIALVIVTWGDLPRMTAVTVFGMTAVLLYSASAALHLSYGSPKTINRLNRLDRASIFIVIAGTYTPMCHAFLEGNARWVMLVLVWSAALCGSLYTVLRFRRGISNPLPMTLAYIGMGALGLLIAPQAMLPTGALLLILAGGAIYLVGCVIYSLDQPNLHENFNAHDLWHIFVLAGSVLFFAMVFAYIVPA